MTNHQTGKLRLLNGPIASLAERIGSRGINGDNVTTPLIGYGKAFGSFGELVQGRLSTDEDFLITLPICLWSTCEIVCRPISGPLIVECELEKSKALITKLLTEIGIWEGFYLKCNFTSAIPVGKGLSSSTADLLAALRALQEAFGFIVSQNAISRLFTLIEPHDGIHYNSSVAYNHRKGLLIQNYQYIPKYVIIAIDNGGSVDTLEYNERLKFTLIQKLGYDALFNEINEHFYRQNDAMIAKCASRAALMHAKHSKNLFVLEALSEINNIGALGMVVAHSGTCVGFLYPTDLSDVDVDIIERKLAIRFKKRIFHVRTVPIFS